MTSQAQYNAHTGRLVASGADDSVPRAVQLGLEPPRFCVECGRRTIVQVVPNGWSSRCSRHGVIDSTMLGER